MLVTKIVYLNSVDLDERCLETLQQLQVHNYHGVRLKKLTGHQLWSIRTSDAGRLLLSQINFQGERCWLVLEYLPTHGYETARFLKPNVLKRFLENNATGLEAVSEKDFNSDSSSGDDDDNDNQSTEPVLLNRVHYYNHEYICLSHAQQDILKQPFPIVLSGMPGSGKTCIGFVLLEQQIRQNKESPTRLLYITLSETLASNMRKWWIEAYPESAELVKFASIEEFNRVDPAFCALKPVSYAEFNAWFQLKNLTLDPYSVYEEFKCISVANTLEEYTEQSGTRNSLFHHFNDKKIVHTLYQNYVAYLDSNDLVDLYFYNSQIQQQYDFIFVDEAQNLSHTQLRYLLKSAREQQICFAMDTNQNMQKGVSTRPYLLQLITQNTHQKVGHFNLLQTFRNPPVVVDLANAVLQIKNALVGGVADANEYSQAIAEKNSIKQGQVHWFETATAELIASADNSNCAIVVNSQADKKRALDLFASPLIFTREEIQGLQFNVIILFEPFSETVFTQINKSMPDDLQHRILKQHRPKDKNDQSALPFVQALNALYTSVTRSCDSVYIFSKSIHQHAKIQAYLKQATKKYSAQPLATPVKSSEEQWEAKALELEENNKPEQAEAIYKLKVKKARSQKKTPTPTSNVASSPATNSQLITDLGGQLVNGFINEPTPDKLIALLNSKLFAKLFYAVKGNRGLTIIEAIKKDFNFYLPILLQVDQASQVMTVLLRDQAVLSQINISAKNIFTDEVFGQYCQSDIGTQILLAFMSNHAIAVSLRSSKKNCAYFWDHAKPLFNSRAGLALIQAVGASPDVLNSVTRTALFSNKLFQYFSINSDTARILQSIICCNLSMLENFKPELLFEPFYYGINAFSLFCCSETGIELLLILFEKVNSLTLACRPENLFAKNKFKLSKKENSIDIAGDIYITPFHHLAVTGGQKGMMLLSLLFRSTANFNAVTIKDLCGVEDGLTLETRSPLYYFGSNVFGAKLLHMLVVNRMDLTMALPSKALFSKPRTEKSSIPQEPVIYHLLQNEENQSTLTVILGVRPDLKNEFVQFMTKNSRAVISALVYTEVGQNIIKSLLETDKNILVKMDWSAMWEYANHPFISGRKITPFQYLAMSSTAFLFELISLMPELIKDNMRLSIIFDLIFPNPHMNSTRNLSAFMWLSATEASQNILLEIIKGTRQLPRAMDEKQLLIEQVILKDSIPSCAFINLSLYAVGNAILTLIFNENELAAKALPDNLLSRFFPSPKLQSKGLHLPLIFFLAHNEVGCALVLFLIKLKPELLNESLMRTIFYEITDVSRPNEKMCTAYVMSQVASGQILLSYIEQIRPGATAIFARKNRQPVSSQVATEDKSAPVVKLSK